MFHIAQYFPITDPTLIFFVVLLIILFAPIIMGKLRIPHIIGMVLAGVLIGKYGLNILERDSSFELFGKVGLYYIMFLAALEMDMEGMKKEQVATAYLWPAHLFYTVLPHLWHEHLAAPLLCQGFLPAELHHGIQYADCLSYRFEIRTATETERYAECGVEHDFAAHSPDYACRTGSIVQQA